MRRIVAFLIIFLSMLAHVAQAGTYILVDGTKINGEPIFPVNDSGVVFHTDAGEDLTRVPWDKITPESIRLLSSKAVTPHDKTIIEPLVEDLPQEKAARKEIIVKPIEPPFRPVGHLGFAAIFSSPVGLIILLILYCTNIFAAYEVAIYRRQPLPMVCGLAAIPFLGILSPIIFIAMPTHRGPMELHQDSLQTRFHQTAPPAAAEAAAVESEPVAEPVQPVMSAAAPAPVAVEALPKPVIYSRKDFSLNRRFFETRLASFFRLVPSESDKDMVVEIKSSRGDFIGRRIVNITATELQLQIEREGATNNEMIPFTEMNEIQIRHKNWV